MNGPGSTRFSGRVIAPEGTMWQSNVYTGWGGGDIHNNLAGRSQNKNEKGCCQITVGISRTINNK